LQELNYQVSLTHSQRKGNGKAVQFYADLLPLSQNFLTRRAIRREAREKIEPSKEVRWGGKYKSKKDVEEAWRD